MRLFTSWSYFALLAVFVGHVVAGNSTFNRLKNGLKTFECTIDTEQAIAYLAQSYILLETASGSCPRGTRTDCLANVEGMLGSLTWVASYVAMAANACGPDRWRAVCSSEIAGSLADFQDIAASSTAMKEDCNYNNLLYSRHALHRDRTKEIIGCTFDTNLAQSYLQRAGQQTAVTATHGGCKEGRSGGRQCGADVFNILSSLGWVSQFVSLAATDCIRDGVDGHAACSAEISDIVASVSSLVANGATLGFDCRHGSDNVTNVTKEMVALQAELEEDASPSIWNALDALGDGPEPEALWWATVRRLRENNEVIVNNSLGANEVPTSNQLYSDRISSVAQSWFSAASQIDSGELMVDSHTNVV